jgi:hypothetical protein
MFQMDPAACILAVIALVFAWRVERRNTLPAAKLLNCKGNSCTSVDENQLQLFHQFTVRIRNVGIALHNTTVHLVFQDEGTWSTEMPRLTKMPGDHDEFARGMIAEFALKSYRIDGHWMQELLKLTHPLKQKAQVVVKSQGFEAVAIPLSHRGDSLRRLWNRWAFWFNQKFWRTRRRKDGTQALDTREILPMFAMPSSDLMHVINAMRRDASNPRAAPSGPPSNTTNPQRANARKSD